MRDQRGLETEVEPDGCGGEQPQPSVRHHERRQRHRAERDDHQPRAQARHQLGPAPVGDAARDRGGQRTRRAGQAEGTGRRATQVERCPMQHHGQRGPERTEADRQQPLCERGATQCAVTLPELGQRAEQGAVCQMRRRLEARQSAPRGDAYERDAGRCGHEHRAPAEVLGHEAAHDA